MKTAVPDWPGRIRPAPRGCVFICDKMATCVSPLCLSRRGKKRSEGEQWQRRRRTRGRLASPVAGLMFAAGPAGSDPPARSPRTPSSLVSPGASQAALLKGRSCSGSGRRPACEPAGACGPTTCKRVTTFFRPPHSSPRGRIPSCVLFYSFLLPFFLLFLPNPRPLPLRRPRPQPGALDAVLRHTTHLGGQKPPKHTQMTARVGEVRGANGKETRAGKEQTP